MPSGCSSRFTTRTPSLLVVNLEVKANCVFQLARAAMRPTPDLLLGQGCEPALDLIEPGAVGRCVVDLEAGVTQQPAPDQLGLVGPVVIEHDVDLQVGRDFLLDPVQKALELGRAVAPMSLADHLPVAMSRAAKSEVVPCRW